MLDPHLVVIGEDSGRQALLVDGVVQSISPEDGLVRGGYWAAMLPAIRPRQALILGLGGGTLARLLQARWGADVAITGVDDDVSIVETALAAGWLPLPRLEVVFEDAFGYVNACNRRFDYIAVDLFRGERLASRICSKPFLRALRSLLQPHGWLAINFFRDRRETARLQRISMLFDIRECRHVGGNTIVHAHRPRAT